MATRLPTALPRRPTIALPLSPLSAHTSTAYLAPSHTPLSHTPSRAATLIKRPKRPYMFTQLVQLSDGSTYTMRTSSPLALYKSTKDTRNHAMWNPNEKSLQNVETDEAGKLAAFRERFGRVWDSEADAEHEAAAGAGAVNAPPAAAAGAAKKGADKAEKPKAADAEKETEEKEPVDSFSELIATYAIGMPEVGRKIVLKKKKSAAT